MALKKTKKKTTPKKKTNEDIIKQIIEGVSEGMSVRAACELYGMKRRTFRDAVTNNESPYYAQYARAREMQAETHADHLIDIISKVENGTMDPAAARVAADTIKWICCKMLPKVYGDKQQVDLTSSDGSMKQPTKLVVELVDGEEKKDE